MARKFQDKTVNCPTEQPTQISSSLKTDRDFLKKIKENTECVRKYFKKDLNNLGESLKLCKSTQKTEILKT